MEILKSKLESISGVKMVGVMHDTHYYINIRFKKSSKMDIDIIVDDLGLSSLKRCDAIRFNHTTGMVYLLEDGKWVNLKKSILNRSGCDTSRIKNISQVKDITDFRLMNLVGVLMPIKPNYIFENTDNLLIINSVTSKYGYDKFVYLLNSSTVVVEFKNSQSTVQCLMDLDDIFKVDIKRMHPSYRNNENKWRINYTMGTTKVKLHRLITNCPKDLVVDHINRNPLDNRKCNLRCVSVSINAHNMSSKNKSKETIKGVNVNNKNGTVYSRIIVDGKLLSKTFSIKKLGIEQAIALATTQRIKWNEENSVISE